MTPPVTEHRMPNREDVVYYRDHDHSYWQRYNHDGSLSGRVAGASTIAKHDGDDNVERLMDWAVRLDREGVAREVTKANSTEWLSSADEIGRRLRANKSDWRSIRSEAGRRGSVSHSVLEQLCEGVEPKPSNGYDAGVISWWKATRPAPEYTEQVVYSSRFQYAGRFDLLTTTGKLVDLKTSKYISNSYAVQLNLYALAMRDAGFPSPESLAIVQVFEDGSWAETQIPRKTEWALTALDAYRMGGEIRRALTQEKKEARRG